MLGSIFQRHQKSPATWLRLVKHRMTRTARFANCNERDHADRCSRGADAGFWREALAWVGFRVAEFERGDDVPGDHVDALSAIVARRAPQ